jgi:hypothetical protein
MARTSRTSRTERLRHEAGSMMIEALVAAVILLGGGAATLVAFDSITRASHTSEREAEAVAIAEKELERIASKPYAQIANCSTPPAGTGRSDDPQSWVQGNQFFVARNFRPTGGYAAPPPANLSAANRLALEPFVVSNAAGCIPPQEDASSAGVQSNSKIDHTKLYRFVSSQPGLCASTLNATVGGSLSSSSLLATVQASLAATTATDLATLCSTIQTQEAKRITVAVVLNQTSNGAGLKYPVYVSTVVLDPNAALHAATGTVIP